VENAGCLLKKQSQRTRAASNGSLADLRTARRYSSVMSNRLLYLCHTLSIPDYTLPLASPILAEGLRT
jgi:hypothetical protein